MANWTRAAAPRRKHEIAAPVSLDDIGCIETILFDVDGVLLDSLPPHLDVCRRLAAEYGLDIAIPSGEEICAMLARGVVISPMRELFAVVGFPEERLDAAVAYYDRHFSEEFDTPLFGEVAAVLAGLAGAGFRLGIVTANTERNIRLGLGGLIDLFDPEMLFFYEAGRTKADAIDAVLGAARGRISRTVFVGDQPSDLSAAIRSGVAFVPAMYGWGFGDTPPVTPAAESPAALFAMLTAKPAYAG